MNKQIANFKSRWRCLFEWKRTFLLQIKSQRHICELYLKRQNIFSVIFFLLAIEVKIFEPKCFWCDTSSDISLWSWAWLWLSAKTVLSCLLCSCWFTGLVTQPETGKPGSDCLRESSLPVTLDKLTIKHFLFPVTGHRGFLTAPSCYLSLGQHVVSTSSPLLSACSVNLAAHAHATEVRTP